MGSGLTQRAVASAARISQSQMSRLERGQNRWVAVETLVTVGRMVGLDVVVGAYPGPSPVRDTPQIELLGRLRHRLGRAWQWHHEVPVAHGDQRAWDAVIVHELTRAALVVEAETRITDVQALLRRTKLKRDVAGRVRLVLLVADTRWNRAVLAEAREVFTGEFPCSMRRAMRALASGELPSGDSVVVLAPAPRGPVRPAGSNDAPGA